MDWWKNKFSLFIELLFIWFANLFFFRCTSQALHKSYRCSVSVRIRPRISGVTLAGPRVMLSFEYATSTVFSRWTVFVTWPRRSPVRVAHRREVRWCSILSKVKVKFITLPHAGDAREHIIVCLCRHFFLRRGKLARWRDSGWSRVDNLWRVSDVRFHLVDFPILRFGSRFLNREGPSSLARD